MPVEVIRREEQVRLVADLPVFPTVLIGLGGTGRDVLLRVRRKFFERYHRVEYPTVSYLYIDTDTTATGLEGVPLDLPFKEIEFSNREKVDATVSAADIQHIITSPYAYPHINRWFPASLHKQGAIANGAGQVRARGRLAFFHNFTKIQDAMTSAVAKVQNISGSEGMEIDTKELYIYIVCSLAGGTGSGMFLDVAFCLKKMFPEAKRVAFLVLPTVFSPRNVQTTRIYANGYAALKELEHYNLRKDLVDISDANKAGQSAHDFNVEWRIGNEKPVIPPPFTYIYLVDGQNEKGQRISGEQRHMIFSMIADDIFLDFSHGDVARQKRSNRVNTDQYLLNIFTHFHKDRKGEDIYRESFSFRYSALGLSKIHYPVDMIRNACMFRLAADISSLWNIRKDAPADLRNFVMKNIMPNMNLIEDRGTHNIFYALSRFNEQGSMFPQELKSWKVRLRRECLTRMPENIKGVSVYLQGQIDAQMKNFDITDPNPLKHGDYVKRITVANKQSYLIDVKEKIGNEIRRLVNDKSHGLGLAITYLRTISEIIDDYRQNFGKMRDSLQNMIRRSQEEYTTTMDVLSEIEEEWKRHILRRPTLTYLIRKAINEVSKHIDERTRLLMTETALSICDEIQAFIGKEQKVEDGKMRPYRIGILRDLIEFQETIDNLTANLRKGYERSRKAEESVLYYSVFSPDEIDDFYQINGIPVNTEILERQNEIFLNNLDSDVYGLREHMTKSGAGNLEIQLKYYCYEKFKDFEKRVNVLEYFYERYRDFKEQKMILNDIIDRGAVWLKQGSQFMGVEEILQNVHQTLLVGYRSEQDPHDNEFKQIVMDKVPVDQVQFKSLEGASSVLFVTEKAGLPIMYVNGLEDYRSDYRSLMQRGEILHIDKRQNMFKDILIMSHVEIEKMVEANEAFLLGTILGIINIDQSGRGDVEPTYNYIDEEVFGIIQRKPLGPASIVAEVLWEQNDLRKVIIRKIQEKVNNYDSPQQLTKLWILLKYYYTEIYPRTFAVIEGKRVENQSYENRALGIRMNEIVGMLKGGGKTDKEIMEMIKELEPKLEEFTTDVGKGRKVANF